MKCGQFCLQIFVLCALSILAGNATAQSFPAIEIQYIDYTIDTGGDGLVDAGDTIQFEFGVINSGDQSLVDVYVDPGNPGVVMPPPFPEVLAGATLTVFGSYVITSSDISAGEVMLSQVTVYGDSCLGDNCPVSSVYGDFIAYWFNPTGDFYVYKDFTDDSLLEVQVNLTCTDADIDVVKSGASEGFPAEFYLTNVANGNTCTATESVPPGYTHDNPSDCQSVVAWGGNNAGGAGDAPAGSGPLYSCELINSPVPFSEEFTVYKEFSDNNSDFVDMTLSCTGATVDQLTKPASEGSPAVFTVTEIPLWDGPAPYCTATEDVPVGYIPDESDCEDVAIFGSFPASCTIYNEYIPSDAIFTVNKVFSDDNTAEVQISLSCTDAVIDDGTKQASMGNPAEFVLSDVGSGNSCTATEQNVPAGYLPDEGDCNAVAAGPESTSSCEITNTRITGDTTFTVSKAFSDGSVTVVQISLSCTAASIDESTKAASIGSPAVFNLTEVSSGNTCTATEPNVPAGYEPDDSDCDAVSADPESSSSCQITNTKIPAGDTSFTVSKVFSDDNPAAVQISLTCTQAAIDDSTKSASAGSPAVFDLTEVGSGNTCTATEQNVPAGYESDDSDCAAVSADPESSSSCQITNTRIPSTASFTVEKVFSDNNSAAVQVSLSCTGASIDGSSSQSASMGSPAVFSLINVVSGNTCTATESAVPAGYDPDDSDCAAVSADPESSSSCQITNTLVVSNATFTVGKVFSDDNSAVVQISLTCTAANIDNSPKSASMGSPAIFNLSNVGSDNSCTATEQNVPAGYDSDNSACAGKAAGPDSANSCQITNTPTTPADTTFEVFVDFSGTAQVTLACSDAGIDASTKPGSATNPAVFILSNAGVDNVCTAKVEPPDGFLATGCNEVPAPGEEPSSCTINFTQVFPPDDGTEGNGLPTGEYVLSTCQDAGNEPDYQALCNAYVGALLGDPADQAAAANATEQITTDNAAAVRTTGMQTTMVQVSAVDGRLGTLRGGGGAGFSASGFSVAVGDAMVNGSLLKSFLSNFNQNNPAFMQAYANQYQANSTQNMAYGNQSLPSGGLGRANAGQSDDAGFLDEFGRWGIWISGRIIFGDKDLTSLQYDYDFDTAGLTFGADYRFNDNFVAGIAVGYASTSADIGSDNADLDTDGYSVSLYGTWFQGDRFYMAGSIGYGGNDYDQTRNVRYNLDPGSSDPYVNVNESLTAKYDGSQFSAAISGGWEFNKNGWSYGPTFSLSYVDVKVDAYDEALVANTGGSLGTVGWAAHIDEQKYQSLQPTIGFEVSKPYSRTWGVIIPQAYIDVVSEVKDGSRVITGSFLGAFESNKRFSLLTDDFEETFARGGIGLGFVFKNNKSAFFMADADIGRDLLSTYYLNAGFRWQF